MKVADGTLLATTSLANVNQTVDQLELIVAIGSAAAALVAALGVAWLVRRGVRPIETMATQADRISAGDLTGRVSPQDPQTEVGRLGAALNGMLARIEASRPGTRGQPGADPPVLRRRQPRAAQPAGLAARQRRALPAGRPAQPAPGGRGHAPDHAGGPADERAGRRHAPAGPPGPAARPAARPGRPERPGHPLRRPGPGGQPAPPLAGRHRRRPRGDRRRGAAAPGRGQPAGQRARPHPRRHLGHGHRRTARRHHHRPGQRQRPRRSGRRAAPDLRPVLPRRGPHRPGHRPGPGHRGRDRRRAPRRRRGRAQRAAGAVHHPDACPPATTPARRVPTGLAPTRSARSRTRPFRPAAAPGASPAR